jgi:nucleoid-associated protein EbfC
MAGMFDIMKQAQAVQAKMQEVQAELERVEVEGQSGGGMVRVTLTAKGQMKGITLDPSLLKPEDKDMLEDLIVAAHDDARKKGERVMEERMQSLTAGLPLPPGFKLPF